MIKPTTFFGLLFYGILCTFFFSSRLYPDTFRVQSTSDQGEGSLSWAIEQANSHVGADTITFAIPKSDSNYIARKGYWEIDTVTPLPALTDDSTFVDGATQAANIADTNPDGLEIVINGSAIPVEIPGIVIYSAYNKIRAICIGGFRAQTFVLEGVNAHDNIIEACHIGIDADGKFAFNARYSLGILMRKGAHHNTIGGVGAEKRNLISGLYYEAIKMVSVHHNQIMGNYIGTKKTGIDPLGNGWGDYDRQDYSVPLSGRYPGIFLREASYANQIGGPNPGEGNIICASGRPGLRIENVGSDSNIVQGNYFGVGADGETALPNGEAGLWIVRGPAYNLIGGQIPGSGNVISSNHSSGIQMRQANHHNKIIGNYIGTNADGTRLIPNSHNGIYFFGQATEGYPQYNEIGPGNIIIANGEEREDEKPQYTWGAVRLDSAGTAFNKIFGNYIGTNLDGTLGSEWNSGVIVGAGAHDNIIGPDNVIANNHKYGVWIRQANSTGNTITRNAIYQNGAGQILLETGGNDMIQAPVILTVSETEVSGTTIGYGIVEIFRGHDQAEAFIARTVADSSGQFTWQGTLQVPFVTATVTDTSGNTSMLSSSTAVPVELSSFVARLENDHVKLIWQTETETNNYGFYLQRSSDNRPFHDIAFIPGAGTSSEPHHYQYLDREALGQSVLSYRLRQVDFDGRESYSQQLDISIKPVREFTLQNAYPNPFNASLTIRYSLPSAEAIQLAIFNLQGQRVRTLVNRKEKAGQYVVIWDGNDEWRNPLPSGQYFIVLKSNRKQAMRKVILQK